MAIDATALDNTTKAEDLVAAQDIQFVANFQHETDRLNEILGLFGPEVIQAGTTLYQYKVTGTLSAESVEEGAEVPLSKYTLTKEPWGEYQLKKYRKVTTAESILKSGYENAVQRTDAKLITDVRAGVWDDFFKALATGTGTATAEDLQGTLAQMSAKLSDTLEKNHDTADTLVWFLNPYDAADYLAKAPITTQTVFGMTYLESFLGVTNVFLTNKVTAKSVYVTPCGQNGNIHLYGVDFSALAQAGLTYETLDSNLIGVHHDPMYNRVSAETNVIVGAKYLPEVKDFIVKGTISPLD